MKNHQHHDDNNDGKCDECQVEMCDGQKIEGAQNLICSRIANHKGEHYDRRKKKHFA